MKAKFLLFLTLIMLTTKVFAQVNIDPNNSIYTDLYIWENRGYINNLPPQKPYPLPYLIELLNSVVEQGTYFEKEKAKEYLEECENKITLSFKSDTYVNTVDMGELGLVQLKGHGMLNDNIDIAVNGGSYVTFDEANISTLPQFEVRGADYNTDTSNLGPLQLMSTWGSIASFSGKNFWVQSGLTKTSFGPFSGDNVFFSSEAPQTGFFSLTYKIGNVIFTKSFHQLVATDSAGNGQYPEKYLSVNGFKWQALPWLNLGIYDNAIYGGRFDPLYLVPLTQHMYSQGVNGFMDNTMIGVTGEIQFPNHINLKGIMLVDDFAFNDFMKLNLDSKYKFALDARLNWAPENKTLKLIELGYTMLTPHMYTHEPEGYRVGNTSDGTREYNYTSSIDENINYLNYANRGVSMGSTLKPNSDRISLTSNLSLPFGIDLNLFAKVVRNANSNDSLPDTYDGHAIVKLPNGTYYLDISPGGGRDNYYIDPTGTISTSALYEAATNEERLEWQVVEEPLFLGDGSINDHGIVIVDHHGGIQNHWEYIWANSFPFLKQADLIFTYQAGFGLSKKISPEVQVFGGKYKNRDITTRLDYLFERHAGVNNHYAKLSITVDF